MKWIQISSIYFKSLKCINKRPPTSNWLDCHKVLNWKIYEGVDCRTSTKAHAQACPAQHNHCVQVKPTFKIRCPMKTDPVFIVITLNDSWNYIGLTQPITRLFQKKYKLALKSVFQPQSQPAGLQPVQSWSVGEIKLGSLLPVPGDKIMFIGTQYKQLLLLK